LKSNFFRFGFGGIPGAILNYTILYISSLLCIKGVGMVVISVLAFLLREITSFLIHKFWTFQKSEVKTNELKREIVFYIISVAFITTVNTVLFYICVEIYNMNTVLSQFVISTFLFFLNYPAIKKTFTKTRHA
jgi:putative flippase GtrA